MWLGRATSRLLGWLRRLWQTLLRWWRPVPPPSPASPTGAFSERRRLWTITVPAEGDVFEFHVDPVVTWRSDRTTSELLREWANLHSRPVYHEVRQRIVDVSRQFPPHQAAELERHVNAELARERREHVHDGWMVRWQAKVQVRLEDRVREKLLPYWERRIQMECEHQLGLRRADLVDALARRWSGVLEQLYLRRFPASGAKLTDEQFAQVVERLEADRGKLRDDLLELLKNPGRDNQQWGLYEHAEMFDKLVEELQHQRDMMSASPAGRDKT